MILLNRAYDAYTSGTIVQLPTNVEAALVAQGLASASAGPVTPGNVNAGNQTMGRVGIAAAHDRIDHPFLQIRGVQQLVEGVLQGD